MVMFSITSVYVSAGNARTFESLDVESSFSTCRHIFSIFKISRLSSYTTVIWSRSRLQRQKASMCMLFAGGLRSLKDSLVYITFCYFKCIIITLLFCFTWLRNRLSSVSTCTNHFVLWMSRTLYHYPLFFHNMRDKTHTTMGQQQNALFCSTRHIIHNNIRERLARKTNAITTCYIYTQTLWYDIITP